MPKKTERAKAKDKAWAAFSLYIRTRDSLETTGTLDRCRCVTCQREYPRLGTGCIQAGHFIPGRKNAVLFSEKGVHGQCLGCNGNPPMGKGGNRIEYWLFMEKTYGRETIDRLIEESKVTVQYKVHDFERIAQEYRDATKVLIGGAV